MAGGSCYHEGPETLSEATRLYAGFVFDNAAPMRHKFRFG